MSDVDITKQLPGALDSLGRQAMSDDWAMCVCVHIEQLENTITSQQKQMKERDTLFAKIKYSLENSSKDKVWLIQEDWEKLVEYAGDIVGYVPCAESRQYHHSGGQS